MESAHQFSSNPDCNNVADVPSFILRTALKESHLFLNGARLMCNDSTIGLRKLCQLSRICQCE